jgi:protein-S-isoprenylcysteine O-methyltransferase Ste14
MKSGDSQYDYDKSSLKILWITIALSVTVGIILRNTTFVLTDSYAVLIYNVGVCLICLGLFIRWIAILKLKKSFTVNVSISEDQKMVKSGIYKYIRHPAYSGSLLSFLGLGIVFNNWMTLFIIFIPILIAFLYRIRVEEKVLSQAFGSQYTDYIKSSWKLVPKVF